MGSTIFALSSGAGRSGVAVIRVSGPDARAAVTSLAGSIPAPRQATLRPLRAPGDPGVLDRALVLWFPAPDSFTGEDIVEFHVHGGRAVVAAVVGALGDIIGLRPAEPGEFARQAFDNGKLDLTRVEGLADLVDAETEFQRRQAMRQMDGALGEIYEGWRSRVVRALAHMEADMEFPDDELSAVERTEIYQSAVRQVVDIGDEMARHLNDGHRGERLRDGVYVAIVGAPNVGKSSLLNALAQREAAIVSDLAGTTRDVIEVQMDLGGMPVTLADTAGLRASSDDVIEQEGMFRARKKAASADLKIVLCDGTDWPQIDSQTLGQIDGATMVVANKTDQIKGFSGELGGEIGRAPSGQKYDGLGLGVWPLSVRTSAGMDAFLGGLEGAVADRLAGAAGVSLTRRRHRSALEDCVGYLDRFSEVAKAGPDAGELAAEDLRLAARCLGRITGQVDVEDVLDQIFSEFCIGK
jgi:tRNA modification GTPase